MPDMIDAYLLAYTMGDGRITAEDDWGWLRVGNHVYATNDRPVRRVQVVSGLDRLRGLHGKDVYLGSEWFKICTSDRLRDEFGLRPLIFARGVFIEYF